MKTMVEDHYSLEAKKRPKLKSSVHRGLTLFWVFWGFCVLTRLLYNCVPLLCFRCFFCFSPVSEWIFITFVTTSWILETGLCENSTNQNQVKLYSSNGNGVELYILYRIIYKTPEHQKDYIRKKIQHEKLQEYFPKWVSSLTKDFV